MLLDPWLLSILIQLLLSVIAVYTLPINTKCFNSCKPNFFFRSLFFRRLSHTHMQNKAKETQTSKNPQTKPVDYNFSGGFLSTWPSRKVLSYLAFNIALSFTWFPRQQTDMLKEPEPVKTYLLPWRIEFYLLSCSSQGL